MKQQIHNFLGSCRYKVLVASIAAFSTALVTTSVTQASDIEIYQDAKSGDITLMFMIDVSTSMNNSDTGQTGSRWARVQVAMRDLLSGNPSKGVEKLSDDKIIGLSTLGAVSFTNTGTLASGSQDTGAVLVPARRLDTIVSVDGKTKSQRQLLLDRVNTIVMRTNTPTAKSYAETIAYLMGKSTKDLTGNGWTRSHESTKIRLKQPMNHRVH